jgi:hypothetical protein
MTETDLPSTLLLASASWDRLTLLGFEVHVSVLFGVVYLAAAYLFAVRPARVKRGWEVEPVSPWRKASYLGAVAVIFLSLNGPRHTLSDEYLFGAHMVQHMLLMLVISPFLILGVPPWLIRKALERPRVKKAGKQLLTNPVAAYLAYNVTFIGWHIPRMYNWALVSHDLHILRQHALGPGGTRQGLMRIENAVGPTQIQRKNQQRIIFVNAEPETTLSDAVKRSTPRSRGSTASDRSTSAWDSAPTWSSRTWPSANSR